MKANLYIVIFCPQDDAETWLQYFQQHAEDWLPWIPQLDYWNGPSYRYESTFHATKGHEKSIATTERTQVCNFVLFVEKESIKIKLSLDYVIITFDFFHTYIVLSKMPKILWCDFNFPLCIFSLIYKQRYAWVVETYNECVVMSE